MTEQRVTRRSFLAGAAVSALLSGRSTGVSAQSSDLTELTSFVLPGGSEAAARLHVARAVCRRAEREALEAAEELEINRLALVYLNRLSDLLFILARTANAGGEEPLWKPGSSS